MGKGKLNIEVGQTVWLIRKERWKDNNEPQEKIVSKTGNKYFYLEGDDRTRYNIDTGLVDSDYNNVDKVYPSIQDYMDKIAHSTLSREFRDMIHQHGDIPCSLDALKKMIAILNEDRKC